MHRDILFETNRFNLSEVKQHFINPCCFGEDLAAWLRAELIERGIPTIEPGQEDWGWYIESQMDGCTYFIAIGGNPDDTAQDKNRGEWRITIEKHRSVWEKLSGRNKTTQEAPIFDVIEAILRAQPDIKNVRHEEP